MQTQVILNQRAGELLPNASSKKGLCASKYAVLFTSEKATRAAVAVASSCAGQRNACLEILVMQLVPLREELDHPTRIDPNISLAVAIANEAGTDSVTVSICFCRNIVEGMSHTVNRETPIVIGVRRRWRWSWERRVAMKLMNCGYRIYCVGDPLLLVNSPAVPESSVY